MTSTGSNASDAPDERWKTDGHPLLGQRVYRYFPGHDPVQATVALWHPKAAATGAALFWVVHDDGDTEALRRDGIGARVPPGENR